MNFQILMSGDFTCEYIYSVRFDVFPTGCNFTQFIFFWKTALHVSVVSSPILRSTYNSIYSIWYLLTVIATCLYCGRVGAGLSVVWELYRTVLVRLLTQRISLKIYQKEPFIAMFLSSSEETLKEQTYE